METKHREKDIPAKKLKSVEELAKLIKENRSFLIASIKSLPGSQFQTIKKKISSHAKVKVVKKSIAIKAIEKANVSRMEEYVKEDCALLFSDIDPFELSAILSENTTPVKAKVGQIADDDVEIEAGPTELVPGPVISELGALGIKIQIENGKITIKENKIIVKKGDKISENASSMMAKMDIKPFHVGFEPLVAYDTKERQVYVGIKIDREKTLNELKNSFAKALAFAVQIVYPCKETIGFLLQKASLQEKALSKLIKEEGQ